jgi:UDP-N-acetylglucosamine 4-epimerase
MPPSNTLQTLLKNEHKTWLVTGGAGFIGSHIAKTLLEHGQTVRVLDNLTSGFEENLSACKNNNRFTFIQGDIRTPHDCDKAAKDADIILHHAAIGSVQKSIEDPEYVDGVNNGGFLNILEAAKAQGTQKIIYASSSAIYGDRDEEKLRNETDTPNPKSPYAETKCANERAAKAYDLPNTGLRYFNIYGPNQDPNGAYAAVIPKWIHAMLKDEDITIFGDGETVRDFCYIDDVVAANITAALNNTDDILNVATGHKTSLNDLFSQLKEIIGYSKPAIYEDFRTADIKISLADTTRMKENLNFNEQTHLAEGLEKTVNWFKGQING